MKEMGPTIFKPDSNNMSSFRKRNHQRITKNSTEIFETIKIPKEFSLLDPVCYINK